MRDLIKKILSEACPSSKFKEEPIKPEEEDYNKTGYIHAMNYDEKTGKVNIIWKDDLRKMERKYEEMKNMESSIENIDRNLFQMRRRHPTDQVYFNRMKVVKAKLEQDLEILKNELESQSVDTPMTNFFD